jgi:sortase A
LGFPVYSSAFAQGQINVNRKISLSFLALPLCGSLLIGHGAYIHAKAQMAQVLLEIAWFESKHGTAKEVKPWPWADTWPDSRLTVPSLGISRIVLAGVSGQALAFGPGHFFNATEPGERGNYIIAGHRDTHFEFVKHLAIHDIIEIESKDKQIYKYEVEDMMIAHKDALPIPSKSDHAVLTLITCFPFGAINPDGPLRYLVFGKLVVEENV